MDCKQRSIKFSCLPAGTSRNDPSGDQHNRRKNLHRALSKHTTTVSRSEGLRRKLVIHEHPRAGWPRLPICDGGGWSNAVCSCDKLGNAGFRRRGRIRLGVCFGFWRSGWGCRLLHWLLKLFLGMFRPFLLTTFGVRLELFEALPYNELALLVRGSSQRPTMCAVYGLDLRPRPRLIS